MQYRVKSDFFDVVERVDRKEGDVYDIKDESRADALVSADKVEKVEPKKANKKAPVTKKGNLKTK
jgi:hypothetical protein